MASAAPEPKRSAWHWEQGMVIPAGSPWLWAALALVVVALLAIVARLLPPPQ